MATSNKKKVTLMIDAEVYQALRRKVGGRGMGDFLSRLARPHVVIPSLEESYRLLALDSTEAKARREWLSGADESISAENIWRL